jgi:beta-alanine--pyruvate transaminase
VTDIRNYGFAAAVTLEAKDGDPTRRPFEVAMRMWEKGYYVRYGGDTIQLGLPFVIGDDEIEQLCAALHSAIRENA